MNFSFFDTLFIFRYPFQFSLFSSFFCFSCFFFHVQYYSNVQTVQEPNKRNAHPPFLACVVLGGRNPRSLARREKRLPSMHWSHTHAEFQGSFFPCRLQLYVNFTVHYYCTVQYSKQNPRMGNQSTTQKFGPMKAFRASNFSETAIFSFLVTFPA